MFNRAVGLMDLSPGLEEKIRVCNATYTVRFGVRLRGEIRTFTGYRSVHSEQSYDGLQFSGGLTQTLIDRSLGWCRLAFRFGLTLIPIDLTRVFPWTCRPPGNALR